MVGLIILFVGLFLLGWIMIAPLELRINSAKDQYLLSWKGIAKVEWIPAPDDILIRSKIFFWESIYHPLTAMPTKKKVAADPESSRKKKRWTWRKWSRRIIRVLKSFQVKAFRVNLDTGDYVYNSYLYPIFWMLNQGNSRLQINYNGESEILLVVQNRLYRILKALLF